MYFQGSIHDRLIEIYHHRPDKQIYLEVYLNKKNLELEDLINISTACDVSIEWLATGR